MNQSNEPLFSIPLSFRKMENRHIVFWLVKDISWCMGWKLLGLSMFLPTLILSIVISWRTRKIKSELAHNLAVCFWITANGMWMISEFFGFDEKILYGSFEGKHLAMIPFSIGLSILAVYYLFLRNKQAPVEITD